MQYIIDNKKFNFSYKELRTQYYEYKNMTDFVFFADIPKLLHFVTFVGWIKELPAESLLSDVGLIHELIHILDETETVLTKQEIRENFNKLMLL